MWVKSSEHGRKNVFHEDKDCHVLSRANGRREINEDEAESMSLSACKVCGAGVDWDRSHDSHKYVRMLTETSD